MNSPKADVVLIAPAYYERKKKSREQPQLGLAYIAAYLQSAGLRVRIIDAALDDLSPAQIADQVLAANPLIAGFSSFSDDRLGTFDAMRALREKSKDILIVGGGPHFSYCASDALAELPELDAVVVGEGEDAMLRIAQTFAQHRRQSDFSSIEGLVYRREDGQIDFTGPGRVFARLDDLPPPAWHLYPMDRYHGIMSAGAPYRSIGVISSRGCPFQCVYCVNALKNKVRFHSPERFLDDVEYLVKRYGFSALNFQDDSFTASPKHVRAICEGLIARKLDLKWYCSMRVDKAEKELLSLMKAAGCIALGLGIEFAHDDVLKQINKKTNMALIRRALHDIVEVGFPFVTRFYMNSLPGQTRANTIEAFFNNLELDEILQGEPPQTPTIGGAWARIYPGTALERLAWQQGDIFPPGFGWNKPYGNPDKDLLQLANWTMPVYKVPGLSFAKIIETQTELLEYFYFDKLSPQEKTKQRRREEILNKIQHAHRIWMEKRHTPQTGEERRELP